MGDERPVYRAALIGCGRMGVTIEDRIQGRPNMKQPYSHAAGYDAAERVELVAAADIDSGQLETAQERYGIPQGYNDYREMISAVEPDIVSVATPPAPHAEMVRFATEQGVPAIYCEKPLCCSMAEADEMVKVCQKNDVYFNLGVNRRFTPVYRELREMVQTGALGEPQAVIGQCGSGSALWTHSHSADMLMYLTGDATPRWVQAEADFTEADIEGNRLGRDPSITMGYVRFDDGTRGYLTQGDGFEFEVSGERGKVRTLNDRQGAKFRRKQGEWDLLEEESFPDVTAQSGTLECIRELVAALDRDVATSAPIETAAVSHEICIGWLISHRRDGSRVELPLGDEARQLRVASKQR